VKRLHQGVLIVSTLLGSWLGMQAVHEFGTKKGSGVISLADGTSGR